MINPLKLNINNHVKLFIDLIIKGMTILKISGFICKGILQVITTYLEANWKDPAFRVQHESFSCGSMRRYTWVPQDNIKLLVGVNKLHRHHP